MTNTEEDQTNPSASISDHGHTIIDPHQLSADSDHHQNTPSPKIEKRVIKESGSSADRFSDAVTEFSDTGIISPSVVSEIRKVDEHSEVFESPISQSKDAVKTDELEPKRVQIELPDSDTKHSVVNDSDGSHQTESKGQDQDQDLFMLNVPTDIPLVEDFKDRKTMNSNVSSDCKHRESKPVVDVFEVKPVQETVNESQTSKREDVASIATGSESADDLSEAEGSGDKARVMTFGELMEAEIKRAEMGQSVPVLTKIGQSAGFDSKDSVKVGTSEGSDKPLTHQDYGVDASFGSSSRNSLEANWGSVSEISDAFSKSEISDDRSRMGRSDAFEGVSLVESEQEYDEAEASEVKAGKVQKSQPAKSEEAIAKVTNWSTSGHIATAPLRNLMSKAKSPNPEPNTSKKDEDAEKASDPGKSKLTQEAPKVNEESSSVKDSGEGEKVKKKTKGTATWKRFKCCKIIKWDPPNFVSLHAVAHHSKSHLRCKRLLRRIRYTTAHHATGRQPRPTSASLMLLVLCAAV
ncbi:hypothetical protein QVD17_37651 [Tagetes erecta]|uniref:Uncharacterized protein n=1 Tax=Tagetes erecta TaxID=13708 RepID=A0AAD8NJD8_TARER|nr:hypothetical protein QVD17_37651 [Tagetes erecta]